MKAHLTFREMPLEPGALVETLCATEIYPAQIVLMWDSVAMGEPLIFSTLLCCKKCFEQLPLSVAPFRYVYGVVKSERVSNPERELEAA